jgi:hypothetical protein
MNRVWVAGGIAVVALAGFAGCGKAAARVQYGLSTAGRVSRCNEVATPPELWCQAEPRVAAM